MARSALGAAAAAVVLTTACARPAPRIVSPAGPAAGTPAARLEHDGIRRELVALVGPFSVSSRAASDHHHAAGADLEHDFSPLITVEWPETGWLHGFRFQLVDARGAPLPKSLMHHLIVHNLDRRELVYSVAGRLFGVGKETDDVVLPRRVGVPIERGQRIALYVMWHNESGRDVQGVYVRLAMPWTGAGGEARPLSALPIYMDVNFQTTTTTAFDLEPGRSTHSYEFTLPVGGALLGVGGHLHDYGRLVRLEEAETGRELVTLRGRYDRRGRLVGVERKVFRTWFGLKDARLSLIAGRRYRVVGEYYNPTGEAIRLGGMAHMVGLFVPDDLESWPALDTDDPDYRDDLAWLRSLGGSPGHRH